MAATFPYVNTTGPLHTFLKKLRQRFPNNVTASTLKKLGLAAKNESMVINTLRFLGLIDEEGKKIDSATKHFVLSDKQYQDGMKKIVKTAYADLFDTHGEDAWKLDKESLTTFFRMSDDTSDVVGQRQANTFIAVAAEAGMGEIPTTRNGKTRNSDSGATKKTSAKGPPKPRPAVPSASQISRTNGVDMAFTLRIELNLPTTDDKKVFDSIFSSIRENLIEPHRS